MSEEEKNKETIDETLNDWLLEDFVMGLNQSEEGTISITLCVKGAIVTGYLIGGRKYFKELGELFDNAFKGREKDEEEKIDYIEHFGKMAEQIYDFKDENDERLKKPPTYIHLNKVTIFSGIQRLNVELWRGKIKEVDGFSFGILSTDSQSKS
ncbi:MAG: hypothetical protein STSR0008_25370 [Ignavibacterium sp.]